MVMTSKLWGVLLSVAGLAATGAVLEIGWTCPTGGTRYCSHAYIDGGWAAVLYLGALLIVLGIVLVAVGHKRSPT